MMSNMMYSTPTPSYYNTAGYNSNLTNSNNNTSFNIIDLSVPG